MRTINTTAAAILSAGGTLPLAATVALSMLTRGYKIRS